MQLENLNHIMAAVFGVLSILLFMTIFYYLIRLFFVENIDQKIQTIISANICMFLTFISSMVWIHFDQNRSWLEVIVSSIITGLIIGVFCLFQVGPLLPDRTRRKKKE
jgi:apolipoprotein N-acyltransferase